MDTRKQIEGETRKLRFVVVYMSIFVVALFGLVPLI